MIPDLITLKTPRDFFSRGVLRYKIDSDYSLEPTISTLSYERTSFLRIRLMVFHFGKIAQGLTGL